jgi:hypothetical protein
MKSSKNGVYESLMALYLQYTIAAYQHSWHTVQHSTVLYICAYLSLKTWPFKTVAFIAALALLTIEQDYQLAIHIAVYLCMPDLTFCDKILLS